MRLRKLAKPVFIRRVSGDSMKPTLKHGQLVPASSVLNPKVGSIVIVSHNNLEKIKRVKLITDKHLEIIGDNPEMSTDSRTFGLIDIDSVIGTVLFIR